MANLKKGLALILAAATAFTFAPLTSLTAVVAKADTVVQTLPSREGIDSIAVSGWNLIPSSGEVADHSYKGIWVKESKDAGQAQAYKITVEKLDDESYTDKKNYVDVVKVTTGGSTAVTTTSNTADEYYALGSSNNESESVWVVKANSTTTSRATDYNGLQPVGGTYINFTATGTKKHGKSDPLTKSNLKVVITALSDAKDLNSTISGASGTYYINLSNRTETLTLDENGLKELTHIKEGATYNLAYTILNPNKITKVEAVSNNDSIASTGTVTGPTDTNNAKTGIIPVKGGEAGSAVITVRALNDKHEVVNNIVISVPVTVKAKNSKLQVTYRTASGKVTTFTDDASLRNAGNKTIVKQDSRSGEFKNNAITFSAQLNTDKDGFTLSKAGGYLTVTTNEGVTTASIYSSTSDATAGADRGYVKGVPTITENNVTSAANVYANLAYSFDQKGVLDEAQLLNDGANGNKTVQISATADPSQKVTYTLVAASNWHDAATNFTSTSANAIDYKAVDKNKYTVKNADDVFGDENFDVIVSLHALNNNFTTTDGSVKIGSGITAGDTVTLSADAASQYGTVDQTGLVQIKDAKNAPKLFVVIYASKNEDKDIPESTYIVPLNIEANDQIDFYLSDQAGSVDVDTYNYGDIAGNFTETTDTLYIKKGATNQLKWSSNIPDSYLSFKVDDASKIKVSDTGLITAVDDTAAGKPAYVTVSTSSAPGIDGLVNVTIPVVVNELDSYAAPSLESVQVNMAAPTKRIVAKAAAGTVRFDNYARFTEDSTKKTVSGYRHVKSTNDHIEDLALSATGQVTYLKNDGVQYVRARVAGDATHNPSGYTYIAVSYGQNLAENNMTVDTTPIVVKAGESKKIVASGSSITFTSADPSVATVSADGTVTGVKAGAYTTVTVKSAATSTMAEGTAQITVVVTDKNGEMNNDTAKKPSKVTGLKVKNKKGGKVSVTWTKQNQKNIKYYVKKTVGKKSAGKSVGSNKTTLSVKKGATVKVKVKAYIYNAAGTKLVGSYSKTVTLKTDKK